MADKITLISAPLVLAIPIEENGETLVDLRGMSESLVDISRKNVQSSSSPFSCVRKTVALMLRDVQSKLPDGYRLMVKEGYRDIETQQKLFLNYKSILQKDNPTLSQAELYKLASRYIAPPEIVPPHSTGGAIDLTLADIDGQEVDMGTELNADPEESNYACYTNANVSDEAASNRKVLAKVMESAGFVNYPTEWWHWSYGDRYWAFVLGKSCAIYGTKLTDPGGSLK